MAEPPAVGGAGLIRNGSKLHKGTQLPPSAAQQSQMYIQHQHQAQQQQQQQPSPSMHQYHPQILSTGVINGPRTVVLHRHNGDFGFTLRHFIVYPPESCTEPSIAGRLAAVGALNFAQPMDTVFVKKVHQNSPAYFANLQEGDRLLAVNGMPVAGTQYAHVVAAIQQTPKTLTLQVVPKNYDILQTFFSDTAHNPETNQRPLQQQQPQQQQPQQQQHVMYPSMSAMSPAATSTPTAVTTHRSYSLQQQQHIQQRHRNVAEKQESLYSTLQDFTMGTNNHQSAVVNSHPEQYYLWSKQRVPLQQQQPGASNEFQKQYNERTYSQQLQTAKLSNSECDNSSRLLNNRHQHQQQLELGNRNSMPSIQPPHAAGEEEINNRRESSASVSSSTASSYDSRTTLTQNSDLSDSAIMTRLRKSFEQKEEFLRRPSQSYTGSCNNTSPNSSSLPDAVHPQSTFYSRPKRLQKQMWPPMTLTTAAIVSANFDQPIYDVPPSPQQINVDIPKYPQTQHMTQQQLLKEQFLNGGGSSRPTTPTNSVQITTKAICEQTPRVTDEESETRKPSAVPTPPGLRIVSETTKLFELGRPLSPDGIDRELLYKSELSRLTTKQAHPNVALRRREFELRAENAMWRKSTEDKERCDSNGSDTEARATKQQQYQRARSLSADSTNEYTDRFSLDSNLTNGVYHRKQRSREEPYRPKPVRENSYLTAMRNSSDDAANAVILRHKLPRDDQPEQEIENDDDEDDRKMRRTSYLRATGHENQFIIDSDIDSPASLPTIGTPDTEGSGAAQQLKSSGTKSKALAYFRDQPANFNDVVVREGDLNIKVTVIDGKRSQDRSWKTVLAELRGKKLKFTLLRDGKSTSQSPEASGIIDLTNFHVADGNYTKRKHVFKLTTSAPGYYSGNSGGSVPTSPNPSTNKVSMSTNEREILLQAESLQDLKMWVDSLGKVCRQPDPAIENDDSNNNFGSQTAEPQRIAATTVQSTNEEFSPIMSTKAQRKYGLGSRSPSGQSPVTKSRKTPQSTSSAQHQKDGSDKEISGSPKSKTWKGIMARQFRKIQGQPDSGSSNTESFFLEGASIGVPLLLCPASEENQYVPLLIARCTSIVESKGLSVVGIYRIPGNTAGISALHELVNRGMDEQLLKDPRWDDVNVVSSLLKLFLRSLPDPLLPNDLYQHFIDADKLTGQRRLIELKSLLKRLPIHSYETLKHLMCHLNHVSSNCVINLMEPRNLAIVFGPSVVRTANETLETAVKDMKHQCQIVEALVSNYFYFFENDPIPAVIEKDNQSINENSLTTPSASLLLDNVSKIEQSRDSSSRFVANIVQAANRKIRKSAAQRKSTNSSLTPDTMSLESTTSAESREKHNHQRTTKNTIVDNSVSSPIGIDVHQKESMFVPPTASAALNRSSEEESSAFTDSGSMSLKTVTITLDNKLRSLRNSSVDSDRDLVTIVSDDADDDDDEDADGDITNPRKSNFISSTPHKPLTLGENIPFADDSPERPLIQARVKPPRHFYTTPTAATTPINATPTMSQSKLTLAEGRPVQDDSSPSPSPSVKSGDDVKSEISSDDTDASTTSNPREKLSSPAMLFDTEVLREMNRFLTNLQHTYKRTISLNRSLSLNYKNHKNNECCLHQTYHHNINTANRIDSSVGSGSGINNSNVNNNNNNNVSIRARLSLTKDEKTDKNINRRRQLYDSSANNCIINPTAALPKTYRRYGFANNRSIRRRHTVGGTQDYIPMQKLTSNNHNHHQHAVNQN